MRQVIQSLQDGNVEVVEVADPQAIAGQVLIRSTRSLISAGTERMLVEFGRANLLQKALQQPERVRQVLEKVSTDGILPTIAATRSKLSQPITLGYSNVGVVFESRAGAFCAGDRVVSNGNHAEIVTVPRNLCAKIPDSVTDEEAAFTVVGAIALQGIRLVAPSLGETVVVSGLGLIGLLAVQLLRAQGCHVIGIDFDQAKLDLARGFGADVVNLSAGEDPVKVAAVISRGRGVDAVLVAASTASSDPIHQAAAMCRKRGRIVLIGVTGLELNRADFYEKELTFQVSCSYGPGRYDASYEQGGHDYPVGFVRWTEQRNFEAVLDMLANGQMNVAPLISKSFDIADAPKAYEILARDRNSLGLLLRYPEPKDAASMRPKHTVQLLPPRVVATGIVTVGAIGAGSYASRVLLPAFRKAGTRLKTISTQKGLSGTLEGRRLGFEQSTTDLDVLFADPQINTVVICTQHDSHFSLAAAALAAGKHVFVEKPLAITLEQLSEVERAYYAARQHGFAPILMVGFNRRFARLTKKLREQLDRATGPMSIIYTCNAGSIPAEHWTQDPTKGGGRLIGEACHFIDLARYLVRAPIISTRTVAMKSSNSRTPADTASISLAFGDGSIADIHYFSNGHRGFPKERIEVFRGGMVLRLDNFRRLVGYGTNDLRRSSILIQDKGAERCVACFVDAVRTGKAPPIAADELFEVSRAAIEAGEQAQAEVG